MPRNRLLNSLSTDIGQLVTPHLESVYLERGKELHRLGEQVHWVYFPEDCLISLVVLLERGTSVEATTVGNDGFAGYSPIFGHEDADITAVVQIAGDCLRMEVTAFSALLKNDEFFRLAGGYVGEVLAATAQSVACMALHPVSERLARWLLQVRDATERDELPLTQEFLATMLGVYRPTVTVAIRTLESAGLIGHRRGLIRILDGDGLAEASCECYRQEVKRSAVK